MSCCVDTDLPPIIPGDDYPVRFEFIVEETDLPEDQTGNYMQIMLKLDAADPDADAIVNRTIFATGPDAVLGIIDTPISSAETQLLQGKRFVYLQARRFVGAERRTPLLMKIKVLETVIDDG